MGYDFSPRHEDVGKFHMQAGFWSHLLEQCGAYFTCIVRDARWYMLYDERMTTHRHDRDGDDVAEQVTDTGYPAIICNCGGFLVTEEEARVMARIARNYVAIQRTLEEPSEDESYQPFDNPKPFPRYIRRDWVDQLETFADWAEKSGGFEIW